MFEINNKLKKNITKLVINKTRSETDKIAKGKSYISLKTGNKIIYKTGGEAINLLLKKIKLEQTYALKTFNK